MSIYIPTWLLWTIGLLITVPGSITLIGLAWLGLIFCKAFKGGIWR
jgi:hypothetical protein